MNLYKRLITPRWLTIILSMALVGWVLGILSSMGLSAQTGDPPQPVVYSDVSSEAWYHDYVESLANDGVFDGTDCQDQQFCPGDPLKRWQMSVWLMRALGETDMTATGESRFSDVEVSDWYLPYVERMADRGVTVGCSSDPPKYCPDRNVTRGQMASFLTRALDLPPAESAGFVDVDSDGAHSDNINRLSAAGITVGCKSEPFQYCPGRSVTRAQMAAFIYRALEWLEENRTSQPSTTAPTPVLVSNDTDEFITEENDFSRYIRDEIVDKHGADHPWLRDTWNHTNRADFKYLLGNHYPAVYRGSSWVEGDALTHVQAHGMTSHPASLSWAYQPILVHELAHIYTVSNRIVANPAPIAAAYIYFSEITQANDSGRCSADEIYADAASGLVFGRASNYWQQCPLLPGWVSDEAVEVVGQAFSGQMPQWFYDTFQDDGEQLDYQAIWEAVGRIKIGVDQLVVINQFRYSFGGYCSEDEVWQAAHLYDFTEQHWVDGGC